MSRNADRPNAPEREPVEPVEPAPARKPISTTSEWTFDLIREYNEEIAKCAEEFGLDT
jgi:stage V sporulation protein R